MMKRIFLTALSVTALISFSQAQTTAPTPQKGGLQINTHGLKPKTAQPKSSTGTGTSTTTPAKSGMPSGGGSTGTTSGGGMHGHSDGSTTTTPSSTTPGTGTGTSSGGGMHGHSDGSTTNTTPSNTTPSGSNVNPSDASNAVTQLLSAGVKLAVSKVGATNGYFGNPEIKIPLPPALQQVGTMLTNYGAGALVNELTLQINRSAEQSASLATPIFINSLTQITPSDAVNIITGSQQDAATQFLKRTTTEQLVAAFKPQVKKVLDATQTSNAYEKVMNLYNKIPFVSPVSADLPDYVTRKALDGLFLMVGKEEAKIRQNPSAAGSSILSKVLGSILGGQGVAAKKK